MHLWSGPITKVIYLDQGQGIKHINFKRIYIQEPSSGHRIPGRHFPSSYFPELIFLLNKRLFPRNGVGLAKGPVRGSC